MHNIMSGWGTAIRYLLLDIAFFGYSVCKDIDIDGIEKALNRIQQDS